MDVQPMIQMLKKNTPPIVGAKIVENTPTMGKTLGHLYVHPSIPFFFQKFIQCTLF